MRGARTGPNVESLVPLYYAALYRYAFRLAGSASEAEDLTQDTFCTAQSHASQLRDPSKVKAWLFSILRNGYLIRLRKRKRTGVVSLESLAGLVPQPTQEAFPQIDAEQLQRGLDTLPEEYRSALILYYFEDFSYRDIAEHLGIPMGTVMSRLARAKEYLRKKLMEEE